jgi:hypothetical protein
MSMIVRSLSCRVLLASAAVAALAARVSAQTISFTEAAGSPIAVGTRPSSVALADFNGDGQLDVAVVNSNDNTVTVFLGNGGGTFGCAALTFHGECEGRGNNEPPRLQVIGESVSGSN